MVNNWDGLDGLDGSNGSGGWEGWSKLEDRPGIDSIRVGGVDVQPGDHVRLRPRPGGDIFDIALAGMVATVESILQDYEDRIYVAVTVDDDPGRDLGARRQPGHRFFFAPDEVEPLGGATGATDLMTWLRSR